jgi:hypothetical protein
MRGAAEIRGRFNFAEPLACVSKVSAELRTGVLDDSEKAADAS